MGMTEQVTCDVCGLTADLTDAVKTTWLSQLFTAQMQGIVPAPPGGVIIAEVHCPTCAKSFDMALQLAQCSAQSEVDIN